jgi:threonine dehydrogenase-like Zn-dependent dehydrogenase
MSDSRTVRSLGVEHAGKAYFFSYEEGPPPAGQFRVDTLYSGISSGTELTFLHGTNPYLKASWDQDYGLFRAGEPSMHYPVPFLGYMEVGRVTESRAATMAEGTVVAMAYGHKTGHTVNAHEEYYVPLPAGMDPILGIYVAQMGPICANGLLHAAADLVGPDVRSLGDGIRGRNVVVFGAGVVGLITAMFARHHGAADVLVVNSTGPRLDAARAIGFEAISDVETEPWHYCKEQWHHGPRDRGADVVFQCRPTANSLREALRCLRPQGTVIDMAFYQGGAQEVRLGEEFHHNGLTIRCAQINHVPPGQERIWTRRRLSDATIELLQAEHKNVVHHLLTDVVPFDRADTFLTRLAATYQPSVIQAVLEMPAASDAHTNGRVQQEAIVGREFQRVP